jgi:hypothetical protein
MSRASYGRSLLNSSIKGVELGLLFAAGWRVASFFKVHALMAVVLLWMIGGGCVRC